MAKENAWLSYNKTQEKALEKLNAGYKTFITESKTERKCVENAVKLAEEKGFQNLETLVKSGKKLKTGDKVYAVGMKKTMALFVIGKEPMENGMNILGAHIDSPRIDVKQIPVYEEPYFATRLAYFDTHYYGGIRKYQWLALPLAIYGVVVKKDGTVLDIAIGDKEDDPVFAITDLLPHLAADQVKKTAAEFVDGEKLDLLVASKPMKDEESKATKKALLKILEAQYQIEEDDFISAELEIVPAGKARDCGFDRSMVMGYGQDDRVCAYTSLEAILEVKKPGRTSVCLLTDKEEIGSVGATGAHSHFFENAVAEILNLMGETSDLSVRRALSRSKMLSSDVSAAYDPLYASVMEHFNSAFLGYGVCFNKYTGSRGKVGSNDASAEYIASLRKVMDDAGVKYQTSELGRVDAGGGGTIAYISAAYGMEVIDSGVPVLSMHAPWEICSKADIFEAYKAYKAFLEKA